MKILIIDPNSETLDAITGSLKSSGYEVIKTCDPLKGLELSSDQKFDIVIIDIWMKKMSEIEFLIRLQHIHPIVRVIIVTAEPGLEIVTLALNYNIYAMFGKPVDLRELNETIREIEFDMKGGDRKPRSRRFIFKPGRQ